MGVEPFPADWAERYRKARELSGMRDDAYTLVYCPLGHGRMNEVMFPIYKDTEFKYNVWEMECPRCAMGFHIEDMRMEPGTAYDLSGEHEIPPFKVVKVGKEVCDKAKYTGRIKFIDEVQCAVFKVGDNKWFAQPFDEPQEESDG